ncbi:MAG TPA: hypothetical protein VHS99_21125 [Chloroflexota bacterium]|jgi:hypothetical protein|nr:hypothetical protein [Chloroflexota bacterium]
MKLGLQFPRFDWPGGRHTLGATLADIARKLAVLRRHCEDVGRDDEAIGREVIPALAER